MLGLFYNLLDILFALSSLAKPIVEGKSHKMPIKHRLCLFSSCYYPEVEDPFRHALFKSKIFLSETYNFAQNTVHGGVIVFTIDWNLGYGDFHFKYFFTFTICELPRRKLPHFASSVSAWKKLSSDKYYRNK